MKKNMNKQGSENSVSSKIEEAIKSGQVKMRPRWHFILKTVLAISGALFALLTILYLASLIIFILRLSGAWFAPAFGIGGIYIFLSHLPWLLVFLAVVFITVLELLASRYSLAYRQPLLYSALVIIILSILGGYGLERTELHGRLADYAEKDQLPFAGQIYRNFNRQRFNDILRGEVSSTTDEGIIIKNRNNEYLNIIFTPQTRFSGKNDFKFGDFVVILGDRDDQNIQAKGVSAIKNK